MASGCTSTGTIARATPPCGPQHPLAPFEGEAARDHGGAKPDAQRRVPIERGPLRRSGCLDRFRRKRLGLVEPIPEPEDGAQGHVDGGHKLDGGEHRKDAPVRVER
jgi:hypothetical protein